MRRELFESGRDPPCRWPGVLAGSRSRVAGGPQRPGIRSRLGARRRSRQQTIAGCSYWHKSRARARSRGAPAIRHKRERDLTTIRAIATGTSVHSPRSSSSRSPRRTGRSRRGGPYAQRACGLLHAHAVGLCMLMSAYVSLVGRVAQRRERMVITQGEPDAGNVMTASGGLVLPALVRPGRDQRPSHLISRPAWRHGGHPLNRGGTSGKSCVPPNGGPLCAAPAGRHKSRKPCGRLVLLGLSAEQDTGQLGSAVEQLVQRCGQLSAGNPPRSWSASPRRPLAAAISSATEYSNCAALATTLPIAVNSSARLALSCPFLSCPDLGQISAYRG